MCCARLGLEKVPVNFLTVSSVVNIDNSDYTSHTMGRSDNDIDECSSVVGTTENPIEMTESENEEDEEEELRKAYCLLARLRINLY